MDQEFIKKLAWIVVDEYLPNEVAIRDALLRTIQTGGYFPNTYYAIIVNKKPLIAWINSKHFLHFYIGRSHFAYDSKGILNNIDKLDNSSMKILQTSCIMDNRKIIAEDKKYTHNLVKIVTFS